MRPHPALRSIGWLLSCSAVFSGLEKRTSDRSRKERDDSEERDPGEKGTRKLPRTRHSVLPSRYKGELPQWHPQFR